MRQPEKPKITYSSPLQEFVASVKRVGLYHSLQLIMSRLVDTIYDWRYGLDTNKRSELSEMDIEADSVSHGSPYQPTGVMAFSKLMQEIEFPADPVFIDYGCGRGRTLVLAAMAGFKKITGIEFAEDLCQSARANIDKMQGRFPGGKADIIVICDDVKAYEYTDTENVFYFFYPFDNVIMNKVVEDIESSINSFPREAVIIEYVPLAIVYTSLSESKVFKLDKRLSLYGYECRIYRTKGNIPSELTNAE